MNELNLSALNFIDITIIVIFLISIIIGFGRGLVSEFISLLTLVAAFAVAIIFTNPLAEYFTNTSAVQNAVQESTKAVGTGTAEPLSYMTIGVSFTILFGATVVAGIILKWLLNMMISGSGLGIVNRFFGGIFGAVRAYLFTLAVIFIIQLSPLAKQQWWTESQYVPLYHSQLSWLADHVSPSLSDIKATINDQIQEFKTTIDTDSSKT